VPIGLFVVWHVWSKSNELHRPAVLGDEAGLGAGLGARVLCGALLGALALHVVLGLVLWARSRKQDSPYPFSARWMKILERVAALGALGLVVFHLNTVVLPWMTGRLWPADVRSVLVATLSSTRWGVPLQALGTTLGLACLAVHLGQGLWAASMSWGVAQSARAKRLTTAGCTVLAIGTFALSANVTVELATGSALTWPWQSTGAAADDALPVGCPDSPGEPSASSPPVGAPSASAIAASSASMSPSSEASAMPAPSASAPTAPGASTHARRIIE
jgi:succinate dehydrogenase/fumarate reductase cytochrome b subunit